MNDVLSKLRAVLLILRNPIISAVRGFVGVCVSAAVVFAARGHIVISTDQEAVLDTAVFALVMAGYVFAVNAAAKRWPWIALLLGTPHTADYQRRRAPLKRARSVQLGQHVVFGRLKEHDPRSRNYPAALAGELVSITHRHYGGPLDQGQLGSCTGNAITDACMTSPIRARAVVLTEQDALRAYGLATVLDSFPGTYPPDDTGSSGLAACKAAKQLGWIDSYAHAFGLDQVLRALVLGPVIIGVGWREGMMDTDSRGYIHAVGSVVGGHEVCLVGLDVPRRRVTVLNSWGRSWGNLGRAYLSWEDLDALLHDDGDATVPQRNAPATVQVQPAAVGEHGPETFATSGTAGVVTMSATPLVERVTVG